MRVLTILCLFFWATAVAADFDQVKAAAKVLPNSWITMRPARHKPVEIDYFEAINGDMNNIRRRALSEYAGDVVVVNFWASWCGPCAVEKPRLQNLKRSLGAPNVKVVTINHGGKRDTPAAVQRFYEKHGVTDFGMTRVSSGKQLKAAPLRLRGLPASYLIDPQGRLLAEIHTISWDDPKMRQFLLNVASIYR